MICSLIVVVINAIFGTILAWILVRDEFPGKSLVNAVIDLPFALPTIVASLTLLALYGNDSPIGIHIAATRAAVVVALMFVTLPFVVRAVQPLLLEMDREMEAAAASLGAGNFTIFRRIIFPNLLPGLAAGVALAFARALGEFGSVLLFAGGLPQTMVASVFIRQQIESGNDVGASAVSVVLLAASLLLLGVVSLIQRWAIRHDRGSVEIASTIIDDAAAEAAMSVRPTSRWGLRVAGLGYLTLLLLIPLGMIFYKTFEDGIGPPLDAITSPDGLHALKLTLLMVAIAVPLNTIFGVGCALLLVRHKSKANPVIDAVINLPFAISPVVIGLSLFLLYGTGGWLGPTLAEAGIKVLFSVPGMVLASIFVSLPFVVRETVPVLQEIGTDQEMAASTLGANAWQTFWRITLPSIRWGVAYGVVLTTARVLGEFGAVTIVSGSITGQTQTLPLFVEKQFANFNLPGAYGASLVLALLALLTLFAMNLLKRKEDA